MREADKIRTGLSRRLRRDSTNAELRLWNRLRSRSIDGHKLTRQQPIGRYIVDFVCRERRLIVEVDGGQHAENSTDHSRDQWLRDHNYRVLRFWNNDIMNNMDGVLEIIAAALRVDAPPHPVPTSAGGGNRPLPASGER
jgi:very-short-patch-repair endonuclease